MTLDLTSPSFVNQSEIPTKHVCTQQGGADVAPALAWSGVPPEAKSLALIVDDPDAPDPRAPKKTWVHWVVYDIPPSVSGLPEGVRDLRGLPDGGARDGRNDYNTTGYRGPCPPIGRHRYFHKLYALDVQLPDLGQPDKATLERAMKGHIVAQATLVGTYAKR